MGSRARDIVEDVEQVIARLNEAFASEWLAYYQYWIGAKMAVGFMKDAVVAELEQHASDELGHATLVADRIITLGGKPILTPTEWFTKSPCDFVPPSDFYTRTLLEENLDGERCAINSYKALAEFVKEKDVVTYQMILDILEDEEGHEEDLQRLEEDMDLTFQREDKDG